MWNFGLCYVECYATVMLMTASFKYTAIVARSRKHNFDNYTRANGTPRSFWPTSLYNSSFATCSLLSSVSLTLELWRSNGPKGSLKSQIY